MHKKIVKRNTVPMSSGLVPDNGDCPELLSPEPTKHTHYPYMVAKVQFAAYVSISRMMRLSSLSSLVLCLDRTSLKLKYRRDAMGGLDVFTDSDWGNSVSRRSTPGLLVMARYDRDSRTATVARQNAKDTLRQCPCPRQRQSTTWQRPWPSRSHTSATASVTHA